MLPSTGDTFEFYTDVAAILRSAHERSITMALASRTCAPDLAHSLLRMLVVKQPDGEARKAFDFFAHKEIYPGDKRTHMKRINKASGIAFEDMLFFDDENRNRNVESLGVCFWLVRDGVTKAEVDRGVKEWRMSRGFSSAKATAET